MNAIPIIIKRQDRAYLKSALQHFCNVTQLKAQAIQTAKPINCNSFSVQRINFYSITNVAQVKERQMNSISHHLNSTYSNKSNKEDYTSQSNLSKYQLIT